MAKSKRTRPPSSHLGSPPPTSVKQPTHELPVDLALQAWLADLGELAGPLAHGFSNFLNVVLLHVAVLEQEGPGSLSEDLAEIRRQGAAMAAWIRHFQKHRQEQRSSNPKIDVNHAVRVAAEAWTAPGPGGAMYPQASLHLKLAPALPAIRGCGADVRRLIRLLLAHASAAAGAAGTITVRTHADAAVTLSVEDNGLAPPPEQLAQLFEQMAPVRADTSALELAACRSLVRRLDGSIRAASTAEGGVAIVVELPSVGAD